LVKQNTRIIQVKSKRQGNRRTESGRVNEEKNPVVTRKDDRGNKRLESALLVPVSDCALLS